MIAAAWLAVRAVAYLSGYTTGRLLAAASRALLP